jgi:hypothetical protein
MSYSAWSPSTRAFAAGAALAAADLNGAFGAAVAAFSAGASYSAGQQVSYNGLFWTATTAVSPGLWNPAQWTVAGFPSSGAGLLANNGTGTLTWAPRMWVDAREFAGFAMDGQTDCGPALQAAVNYVAALGGGDVVLPACPPAVNGSGAALPISPVYTPASGGTPAVLCNPTGIFPIIVNTGVNLNGLVRIIGQGWNETCQSGTLVYTTNTACTPFNFNGEAAVGCSVERVAFMQNQPAPVSGWTPTIYAATIYMNNTVGMVTVRNCFFYNCYLAIDNDESARCDLDGIWGQPLGIGIRMNYCYDCSNAEKIHFWPYWSEGPTSLANGASRDPSHYVVQWMQAHAHAIALKRVDGLQCPSIVALGYFAGLFISYSAANGAAQPGGGPSRIQIGKVYCDSCTWSVYFDPASTAPPIIGIDDLRTGAEGFVTAAIAGGGSIYFGGGGATLTIGQAELFYTPGSPVQFAAAGGGNNLAIGVLTVTDINETISAGATPGPIFQTPTSTTTPNQIIVGAWLIEEGTTGGASIVTAGNAWVNSPQNTPLNIPVASGGTANLVASRKVQMLNTGSSAVSGLTVTLPTSFPEDCTICITCIGTGGITGITWNGGGTPVVTASTSLASGAAVSLMYINVGSESEEPYNAWITVH